MSEKATLAQRLIEFARLQEERECGEAHIHSKNMRAIWDECVQETEKAEAALAAVMKERDEAVARAEKAEAALAAVTKERDEAVLLVQSLAGCDFDTDAERSELVETQVYARRWIAAFRVANREGA